MQPIPDGSWSAGASALIERIAQAVAGGELSVPGAAQAFSVALGKQAVRLDESEDLRATLQYWVRGLCK